MENNNLINLKDRTKEERIAIARKGGLVRSEKKTLANSIKNVKSGIYSTKFTQKILELSKNPEQSSKQIFNLIERIGDNFDNLEPNIQLKLARLLIDAHRAIHNSQSNYMQIVQNSEIDVSSELKAMDNYINSIK